MNKKGFTLMELLLVVAILAIVAAAVAPAFFGSIQETIEETRKAGMLSAYQNTVSGANIMVSIMASKGISGGNTIVDLATTGFVDENNNIILLEKFAPAAGRTFKDAKTPTVEHTFSAQLNGSNIEITLNNAVVASDTKGLNKLWADKFSTLTNTSN